MSDLSPSTFIHYDDGLKNTRRLRGIKFPYYCPFWQPDRQFAILRVRHIKNPPTEDIPIITQMIHRSLREFQNKFIWAKLSDESSARWVSCGLLGFDCIVMVPSSSKLNRIIETMLLNNGLPVLSDLLKKNPVSECELDESLLLREISFKTERLVRSVYDRMLLGGDNFEAKKFNARLRRYFYNCQSIQLPDSHPHIQKLKSAKKILIMDDTIAETTSMVETAFQIQKINPSAVFVGFSLVRDMFDNTIYSL